MQIIWMVITNSGDGSNSIRVVKDREVLDKMQETRVRIPINRLMVRRKENKVRVLVSNEEIT